MKTMTLPGGEYAVLALHIPQISGYGYAAGVNDSCRTANIESGCATVLAPATPRFAA